MKLTVRAPGLSIPPSKVAALQDRFRLDLSDEDAGHFFLELIHESLNAIAPVVLEKFHRMAVAFKY